LISNWRDVVRGLRKLVGLKLIIITLFAAGGIKADPSLDEK
jgi:hypothetical protein